MCGIIGYIGDGKAVKIEGLMYNAIFNQHRGNDSVGIVRKQGNEILVDKNVCKLESIYNGELEEGVFKKIVNIGSFIVAQDDKKRISKEERKWKNYCSNIMGSASSLAFIHHRKATYGPNTLDNTHPIEYDGKYYIHNGTANIDSVKGWLSVNTDTEFESETDTEVLAVIYNRLKETSINDEEIMERLSTIFPKGWGVLIEIDNEANVTIIKDDTRELWVYKQDKAYVYASEPTPFVDKYESLKLLGKGIFNANEDNEGKDYTEFSRICKEWWAEGIKDDNVKKSTKCDICKTTKKTFSTFYVKDKKYFKDSVSRKDMCYDCMVKSKGNITEDDYDDDSFESRLTMLESHLAS